jgi:hypothetical protein
LGFKPNHILVPDKIDKCTDAPEHKLFETQGMSIKHKFTIKKNTAMEDIKHESE